MVEEGREREQIKRKREGERGEEDKEGKAIVSRAET